MTESAISTGFFSPLEPSASYNTAMCNVEHQPADDIAL